MFDFPEDSKFSAYLAFQELDVISVRKMLVEQEAEVLWLKEVC